jgi:four helix bundle protein
MAQSYENLNIWKSSMDLTEKVYLITKKFPREEVYGIVSQMRRSAVSIPSNIAEGSSRQSEKDYSRFIEIAIGSLKELENLFRITDRLGYTDIKITDALFVSMQELGQSLGAFRKYLLKLK